MSEPVQASYPKPKQIQLGLKILRAADFIAILDLIVGVIWIVPKCTMPAGAQLYFSLLRLRSPQPRNQALADPMSCTRLPTLVADET
jgi:hypothetical protein